MKYKIHKINPTWFKKGELSGFSGRKHSLESRRKMSKSLKGRPSWNKGKKLHYTIWNKGKSIKPNNALEIWRKSGGQVWNKGLKFKKEEHPLYGKKFSEESKRKMSKSRLEYLKTHPIWNKNLHIWRNRRHPMLGKHNSKRGTNHWNWKGGVSKGYKTKYNSLEYRNWRRDIFVRDEFTCQECGIKHIYITAHHIKSFAYYPKLRFDVNNGITLCEECHKKTDNYMGRARRKQCLKF